jgi:ATP-binding cassette subfamily F protein uup
MDKVVDHILVFQGEGDIRDFPGNYTQYRDWKTIADKEKAERERIEKEKQERKMQAAGTAEQKASHRGSKSERKLTYKEKKEMEQLEADLERLEKEKADIEAALSSGTISVDEITEMSKRLPMLNDEIDEKTMRWLELSEI